MADPTIKQLDALVHLWDCAQQDHGASSVCARFLLSLYNGPRFPFDLTELRRLDRMLLREVFDVLAMDHEPAREVHQQLNLVFDCRDMGARFEHLAHRWRLKGAAKRVMLPAIDRALPAPRLLP